MPDKKQLLSDFYGKYAPQEQLTKERIDAIEKKYGNDNQRMLRDFYAKYAPQEELTSERISAIENKYGLKKKEQSTNIPTASSGTASSMVSRPKPKSSVSELVLSTQKMAKNVSGLKANVPSFKPQVGNLKAPIINKQTEAKTLEEKAPQIEDTNILGKINNIAVETLTSGVNQMVSGIAGFLGAGADLLINKKPNKEDANAPFLSNQWFLNKVQQQGEVKDPSWFSNQGIRDNLMDFSKATSQISLSEAEIAKREMGVSDYKKSSIDFLLEGNYKDMGKSLLIEVGQQIPNMVAMGATGGSNVALGAMGVSSAGSNMLEQYKADGDINSTDFIQGLTVGTAEAVATKLFDMDIKALQSIGGKVSNFLGPSGKALQQKIREEGVDAVKDKLVRNISGVISQGAKGSKNEILEEGTIATVDYLTKALDEDVLNKDGFDKFIKDLGQATLLAGASGGGIQMLAAGASLKPLTQAEKTKVSQFQDVINDPNTSKEIKRIAQSRIDAITDGLAGGSEELYNKVADLPVPERVQAIDKLNRIKKLQEESQSMPSDIKDQVQSRISELQTEVDNLLTSEPTPQVEEQQTASLGGSDAEVIGDTQMAEQPVQEMAPETPMLEQPTPTEPTFERVADKKQFDESVSTKENVAKSLSEAKKFQPDAFTKLETPVIGEVATFADKDKVSEVSVVDYDAENKLYTIEDENGKQKVVSEGNIKRSFDQIADSYFNDPQSESSQVVNDVIAKDISDPEINRTRTTITPIADPNRVGLLMDKSPKIVRDIYDKYFKAGNKIGIRAKETGEAIAGAKRQKLEVVSTKLNTAIGKDKDLSLLSNTVLSKANIDEKIDSLKNASEATAMAKLSGISVAEIENALANPTLDESVEILKSVNSNIRATTETGTKKEVSEAIESEIDKDAKAIRSLAAEWINYDPRQATIVELEDGTTKERTIEDIEADLKVLNNGEKVVETLQESKVETDLAVQELMKTKKGKRVLSATNEARDLIKDYANWVQKNISALKIKDTELGKSVVENASFYMKRGYEYWNDNDFKIDEQASNAAVNEIYNKRFSIKMKDLASTVAFTNASEAKRAKMVKELSEKTMDSAKVDFAEYVSDITATREFKPANVYPNDLKVNSKNTWQREFVSEAFQKVLGNKSDVVDKLHQTVIAQAQIQSAAETGLIVSEMLGEDNMHNSEREGVESMIKQGMTPTEAGEAFGKGFKEVTDKLSPLAGKWIPIDVHDTVYGGAFQANENILKVIGGATIAWRTTKTVLNPAGHFKNGLGGHITIAEQGHGIDNNTLRNMQDRFKLMLGEDKLSPQSKALREKLINTGVWGSNTDIGDLKLLYKGYFKVDLEDATAVNAMDSKMKDLFKRKYGSVARYYGATDSFTKLILFDKKKDIFANKVYGKNYSDLSTKEEAVVDANIGERIKQNVATMSRLPKFAKNIIGSVVVGDFQGFRFGQFTSFINTTANAVADLHKGLTDNSLSPTQKSAYRRDGLATLSGQVTMAAVSKSLFAVSSGLALKSMGLLYKGAKGFFDDHEDDEGNNIGKPVEIYDQMNGTSLMPEWAQMQNMVPIKDDGNGSLTYVNLSGTLPNDEIYSMFMGRKNKGFFESRLGSVYETFSPNGVISTFVEMYTSGEDHNGQPLYYSNDSDLTKTFKVTSYIASQFNSPGIANLNKEGMNYIKRAEKDAKENGNTEKLKDPIYLYLKGLVAATPNLIYRTYKTDINNNLFFGLRKHYKNANPKEFSDMELSEQKSTIETADKFRKSFIALKNYYAINNKSTQDAVDVFENAFKGTRGQISQEEKQYILYGTMPEFKTGK